MTFTGEYPPEPSPAPVKLCWDCKWRSRWLAKCRAPQNMDIDLVTGLPVPRVVFCANQRQATDYTKNPLLCGPEGKWWMPRK